MRIHPARSLFPLAAVGLLAGCYDLSLSDYTGGDASAEVGTNFGIEVGLDQASDGPGIGRDAFPDATSVVEADASAPDAPDLGVKVYPDAESVATVDASAPDAPGIDAYPDTNSVEASSGGCPTGFHDDGTGKSCVQTGCADGYHDDGLGSCVPVGLPTFRGVSAGVYLTCGVKTDGNIACWGLKSHDAATQLAGVFASVSVGGSTNGAHACGVKADGMVACWGLNDYDQATPPAGTFSSVSAGYSHTCALKIDGTVACWGDNSHGQATPVGNCASGFHDEGTGTCIRGV